MQLAGTFNNSSTQDKINLDPEQKRDGPRICTSPGPKGKSFSAAVAGPLDTQTNTCHLC